MKKRTIIIILLVSVLLGVLVGCAAEGGSAAPSNVKGADADGIEMSGSPSEDDSVTITVYLSGLSPNDFNLEVMPGMVHDRFPNVTVEAVKLPDGQYYTALLTKLANGTGPDIFSVQPKYAGPNSVLGLAQAGYLEPLNDLNSVSLARKPSLDACTYDGNVYAIPTHVSLLGTYYNKRIFEEYRLTIPTTWDEFLDVCQTLKDNGVQPLIMGDKDTYVMQFGLYQLAASEIYAKNPDYDDQLRTGQTKFTDPGTWDKVLEQYTTLYNREYMNRSSLTVSAQQAIQMYIDGQAAMTFDGSFNVDALRAQGAGDVELGFFPLPGSKETYTSVSSGGGFSIYSGSQHKEICKMVLDYMLDGQSELWRTKADTEKKILSYGYGSDKNDPLFQPFLDLYNQGKSSYWCNQAWPAGTETVMMDKLAEYIGGQGTTIQDIVEAMQEKFENLMEQ